jgi:hypothetical protein
MSYQMPPNGEIYLPHTQFIFGAFMSSIVVRTSGDPLALAGALKKAIWAVDKTQPIVRVETLNDVIADAIWRPRFSAWVFSVVGGLALLLTSAGVYGVVAYTTALRTREVGIRVAMGATPRDIIGLILRGAMIPLVTGLAVSLVAALLLSRLLTSVLCEISGMDRPAYVGAAALLLAIGAVASARPAWKAATLDPMHTFARRVDPQNLIKIQSRHSTRLRPPSTRSPVRPRSGGLPELRAKATTQDMAGQQSGSIRLSQGPGAYTHDLLSGLR